MAHRGYWLGKTYYNPRTGQQKSVWRYMMGGRRHGRHPRATARHTPPTRQRTAPATNNGAMIALFIGGLLLGGWILLSNPATRSVVGNILGLGK